MSKNITHDELNDNENEIGDYFEVDNEDFTSKFTVIPNTLLRNPTLSPDCIWLISYLIGHKPGWNINVRQLHKFLKGRMGRDRILRIIKEAISAGYMKCEIIFQPKFLKNGKQQGSLKRHKYTVSSTPKFKKVLPCPDFQGTENQGTENQGTKEILYGRNTKNTSYSYANENFSSSSSSQEVEAVEAESIPDKKPRRAKILKEYSPEVKEFAQKMVNIIQSKSKTYRPPSDMSRFYEDVRVMLEDDRQDPKFLLEVFEWGVNDDIKTERFNGWSSVLSSNGTSKKPTTPAKSLREHASRMERSMKAAPKEKVDRRTVGIDGKPMEKPYLQGLF